MKAAKELQEAIAAAAHEIGHCCVAMETAMVAYERSLEEHGRLLEELVGMVPADESAKCDRCGSEGHASGKGNCAAWILGSCNFCNRSSEECQESGRCLTCRECLKQTEAWRNNYLKSCARPL